MRILLLIPLIYLAAVAETSLADALRLEAIAPDLLALTAALWLVVARGHYAFLGAGCVGLAADLLVPGRIGIGAAAWLLIGYVLMRPRWRLAFEHVAGQMLIVALAVTLWAAVVGLARWLIGDAAVPPSTIALRAIGTGIYTAAVGVPILLVIGWFFDPATRTDELGEY